MGQKLSEVDELAHLLSRTAAAHHQAFIATDGFDPRWTSWYANYLLENGFRQFVKVESVSEDDLAGLLLEADRRHRTEAGPPPWERYYAKLLLEKFGAGG